MAVVVLEGLEDAGLGGDHMVVFEVVEQKLSEKVATCLWG